MKQDLVDVQIRRLISAPGGACIFLAAEKKVVSLFIDSMVGNALQLALSRTRTPRPLTHELFESIFKGLGVKLLQVVIHDCRKETYYARLHLRQQNELGESLVEIDCRPSDAMVLAVRQSAPIRVSRLVWEEAEDVSEVLKQLDEGLEEE